jgi:tetratricopeptide (TPR) repeat protein
MTLGRAAIASGDANMNSGETVIAADMYKKAYEANPSLDTLIKWSRAMRKSGGAQQAVVILQSKREKYHDDPILLTELCRVALSGGYMPEAQEACLKAIADPKANWQAYLTAGAMASRQADYPKATAYFLKAEELTKDPREQDLAKTDLALLKAESGDVNGAIADIKPLAERPGAHARVHSTLAILYGMSGNRVDFMQQANLAGMTSNEIEETSRWLDIGAQDSQPTLPVKK